jgi:catechol 2,3-dioxygenase-like lactoylglutathione lyase family enzyme
MSKPTLNQINLVCGDLGASIAFYRRLGVEIPAPTGGHHAGAGDQSADQSIDLDLDSTEFAQHWNTGWKGRTDLRGRVVIGFGVPTRSDVDAVFRNMIGAGYHGLQEPCDAFWGARYAIIEDPDGIAVGLMSPVSADRKSPPPHV